MDINPLLASPTGIVVLDARVVLYDASIPDADLPRLAIRPYPNQYVSSLTLRDGTPVRVRPIMPEDEPLMARFHERLSEETVYMRYLQSLKLNQRTAHERLTRICFIDYDRELALVATYGPVGNEEIIAVGRLSKSHGRNEAEFAVLVRDDFQRGGLGTALLERLLAIARDEKIDRVVGFILSENLAMQKTAARSGFVLDRTSEPS